MIFREGTDLFSFVNAQLLSLSLQLFCCFCFFFCFVPSLVATRSCAASYQQTRMEIAVHLLLLLLLVHHLI